MLPAIEDLVFDIGISDENQGFGMIDEEDPIKMMTRKSEREKRKKKAKKPMILMTEENDQDTNERGHLGVDQGQLQVLQSVQGIYSYCFLLFLSENCIIHADILYSFIQDRNMSALLKFCVYGCHQDGNTRIGLSTENIHVPDQLITDTNTVTAKRK
jgi:hypothetical protein